VQKRSPEVGIFIEMEGQMFISHSNFRSKAHVDIHLVREKELLANLEAILIMILFFQFK
jgi:hypothetical protein